MADRELLALAIALLTIGCIVGAVLYASRETRRDRREINRGERFRRRKNYERVQREAESAEAVQE